MKRIKIPYFYIFNMYLLCLGTAKTDDFFFIMDFRYVREQVLKFREYFWRYPNKTQILKKLYSLVWTLFNEIVQINGHLVIETFAPVKMTISHLKPDVLIFCSHPQLIFF